MGSYCRGSRPPALFVLTLSSDLNPRLRTAVQAGALRGVPVRLHRPDQELSGRVRGGEEDQPGCRGGGHESVGEGAGGKLLNLPVRSAPGRVRPELLLFFLTGGSRSPRVDVRAVLQHRLRSDWPGAADGGVQQTTASRRSV